MHAVGDVTNITRPIRLALFEGAFEQEIPDVWSLESDVQSQQSTRYYTQINHSPTGYLRRSTTAVQINSIDFTQPNSAQLNTAHHAFPHQQPLRARP
jgi:hypothetical protein